MGLCRMVLSAIAAVAGVIMYWAVTYQGTGFRLSTVGLILVIAGAAGSVVSAIVFASSRRQVSTGIHSMDRQVTDSQGRSSSCTKSASNGCWCTLSSRCERAGFGSERTGFARSPR
jgi:hypothetical protein